MIEPSPEAINASWILTGPSDYSESGNGDTPLADLAVGDYTVTWGDVSGWFTPAGETQALAADSTITFSGTYVEEAAGTGTIVINPDPDSINAPWTLAGPEAVIGAGDSTLTEMPLGAYTLIWGDVTDWITPTNVLQTLAADGTIYFFGTYEEEAADTGSIVIDPEPDHLFAPWTLAGPEARSGTGDETLTEMAVGEYTLTWGDVPDWITPTSPAQTLTADGTIYFYGTYEEEPAIPGTIVIDPSPDSLNAPWNLSGPNYTSGSGDETLTDMTPGDYLLTWGDVPGWLAPMVSYQTLPDDGTITFSGTYIELGPVVPQFVLIDAGSFTMGSPPDEYGRDSDETQHEVTLTTPFHMFNTEITNQQYADLAQWAYDNGHCTATSSSLQDDLDGSTEELLDLDNSNCKISFSAGIFTVDAGQEDHPVGVIWCGSVAYCDWLSLQAGLARAYDHSTWECNSNSPYTAQGYRLPTEAEWEYACRAGTETPFYTGDCLDAGTEANYNGWQPYPDCPLGSFVGELVPVGSYLPNPLGLYDMHGNFYEWCNDWYDESYGGDETDPVGPSTSYYRVLRDGTWSHSASGCRSAVRSKSPPYVSYIAFRPVRSDN